jgi:hypothetical protein
MHIWIVLYITGKLIAAWGPVTIFNNVDQCHWAISSYNSIVARGEDVKLTCVVGDTAPILNSNINRIQPHGIQ